MQDLQREGGEAAAEQARNQVAARYQKHAGREGAAQDRTDRDQTGEGYVFFSLAIIYRVGRLRLLFETQAKAGEAYKALSEDKGKFESAAANAKELADKSEVIASLL